MAVRYLGGVFFYLILSTCCLLGLPYILFPWMILFFVSRSWFHYVCDGVMSSWFRLVPSLLELVYGVKVTVVGDLSPLQSPCLIILNHRTRFDWLFLWCYLLRKGNLNRGKIILSKRHKSLPGFGWAMQILLYVFLSRSWADDKGYFRHLLRYLVVDCKYPLQLVLFPEGTDLSVRHKKKSHDYAAKNGLNKYEYVMHPRTKAFVACMESLRRGHLKFVTDIDIAYKGPMLQNGWDILKETEIHVQVENHPASSLPADSDQLEEWLKETWQNKEERLKYFYSNGRFQDRSQETVRPLATTLQMAGILMFWTAIHIAVIFLWSTSIWFVIYGIAVLVLLFCIDRCGGFDHLVLSWHSKHCRGNGR